MADSLAACLHSVGFEMPGVHVVVPLLGVDGVVEALTAPLQSTGSGSLYCACAAHAALFYTPCIHPADASLFIEQWRRELCTTEECKTKLQYSSAVTSYS